MSSPEAYAVIKGVFDANWTTTPAYFENADWDLSASPAALVYVEVFSSFFDQASIGSGEPADNLWREEGQILAHILVPNGTGTVTARTLAKAVANLFRGKDISGIRFGAISLGAGEPGTTDGNYFRMTSTIEWERDE